MTNEEIDVEIDKILKQMSQPQDLRGPGGVGVTNRSHADLRDALASLYAQKARNGGSSGARATYGQFSKG
jgi:hypothetical protein